MRRESLLGRGDRRAVWLDLLGCVVAIVTLAALTLIPCIPLAVPVCLEVDSLGVHRIENPTNMPCQHVDGAEFRVGTADAETGSFHFFGCFRSDDIMSVATTPPLREVAAPRSEVCGVLKRFVSAVDLLVYR